MTSTRRYPAAGLPPIQFINDFPERFTQVSQEIRLASPLGRKFEYIVGAYYDNSYYRLIQQVGFNFGTPESFSYTGLEQTNFNQRSQTLSAFGQGTYHVMDTFRVVGSLRYTDTGQAR